MDLMIESLNFHVGSLGTSRLLDPTKLGPSAGKNASAVISESSVGSSSEVNSPVSFKPTESIEDTIEELNEIMENLALGESSGTSDEGSIRNLDSYTITDFTTQSGGISDSDEDTRISEGRYINNIHQMCVIIMKAVEDNDCRKDTVTNAQGDNPENNHRKEKEKKILFNRRVEDDHISNQPWHDSTRGFTKRSSNGIPVCPAPAQKEAITRKKRVKEKPRVQHRVK
jgi:hypothetical protein